MFAHSILLAGAIAVALPASQAVGAEARHCLTKEQQRAAISSNRAVSLGVALRSVRRKLAGEMVKARLCEGPKGLVYVLTMLARDGKVTRVSVDAASGDVVGGL